MSDLNTSGDDHISQDKWIKFLWILGSLTKIAFSLPGLNAKSFIQHMYARLDDHNSTPQGARMSENNHTHK